MYAVFTLNLMHLAQICTFSAIAIAQTDFLKQVLSYLVDEV